jgi:thioredoxin
MSMVTLSSETFSDQVIKSGKPVLVDFWAEWCGPCKMLTPIIDELEKEYNDRVTFGKVNIDEEATLAMEYRIMSIPSVLIFKDGELKQKVVGVRDKDEYVKFLQEILD